jgi:hypothetical protein
VLLLRLHFLCALIVIVTHRQLFSAARLHGVWLPESDASTISTNSGESTSSSNASITVEKDALPHGCNPPKGATKAVG